MPPLFKGMWTRQMRDQKVREAQIFAWKYEIDSFPMLRTTTGFSHCDRRYFFASVKKSHKKRFIWYPDVLQWFVDAFFFTIIEQRYMPF